MLDEKMLFAGSQKVIGSSPLSSIGVKPCKISVCGTLKFQLYGLFNQAKHRNYDV